jgi:cellulose biosynthesis protein BcsQ
MTMYDERTNLSRQVVDEVRAVFGELVYKTVVPRQHPAGGSAKPRQTDLPLRYPVAGGRVLPQPGEGVRGT